MTAKDVSLQEQIAFIERERIVRSGLAAATRPYEDNLVAILASLNRLAERDKDAEIRLMEARQWQARFESVIKHLSHIHGLLHPQDVINQTGTRFKFHPPDELVRDMWEGLSRAIREIPTVIDAERSRNDT